MDVNQPDGISYEEAVTTGERARAALGGVYAKINRAEAHLNALDQKWREYLRAKPRPYEFPIHVDPHSGDHTIYAEIVKPPPDTLSIIVGDVLHNLRSALDHMAWAFVERAGGKPGNHTAFPICDTEKQWLDQVVRRRRSRDRRSPLEGIEPDTPIWKFVKAIQPYEGAVYADAMTTLRQLSNADKHRRLLISGMFPDPDDFAAIIRSSPEAVLREQKIFLGPNEPMKDGDKVAYLNFDPAKPDPELRVEGDLAFGIAFSDGRWDSSRPAATELKAAINQYAEYAGALYAEPPFFEDPAQLAELMASQFD
ncbi:MAG TPA: hypothetical protein VI039_11025 [Solirubrobacterales bacterium]